MRCMVSLTDCQPVSKLPPAFTIPSINCWPIFSRVGVVCACPRTACPAWAVGSGVTLNSHCRVPGFCRMRYCRPLRMNAITVWSCPGNRVIRMVLPGPSKRANDSAADMPPALGASPSRCTSIICWFWKNIRAASTVICLYGSGCPPGSNNSLGPNVS